MKRIFTLSLIFVLLSGFGYSQSELPKFISVTPNYSIAFSQLMLSHAGLELGFGQYDERRLYISGVLGYRNLFSFKDAYDRSVKGNTFNAGVKFKYQVLGSNRYQSARWIENMRLCLDFGARYNLQPTQYFNASGLVRKGNVNYISTDLGFSVMIPYSVILKNVKKIFNWSDIFLEVYETIYVTNDLGNIQSTSSAINNVTMGTTVMLSWIYQFQFGE